MLRYDVVIIPGTEIAIDRYDAIHIPRTQIEVHRYDIIIIPGTETAYAAKGVRLLAWAEMLMLECCKTPAVPTHI